MLTKYTVRMASRKLFEVDVEAINVEEAEIEAQSLVRQQIQDQDSLIIIKTVRTETNDGLWAKGKGIKRWEST